MIGDMVKRYWLQLLVVALNGCASPQPALECQKPPPPPAWMMQEPPNLLQTLDGIISITGTESQPLTR